MEMMGGSAGACSWAPCGFLAPALPNRVATSVRLSPSPFLAANKAKQVVRARAGGVLQDVKLCHMLVAEPHGKQRARYVEEESESLWSRLTRAWRVLFPPAQRPMSNAQVAKRRLKMILISDRCSVNDQAKRKIVDNIVGALTDFVEIEAEEKVELNVSSNEELGTVYYVTVPVRRVRPEYQDYSRGDFDESTNIFWRS